MVSASAAITLVAVSPEVDASYFLRKIPAPNSCKIGS